MVAYILAGVVVEWRQWEWQKVLQQRMEDADPSMWGLCNLSQVWPCTNGKVGEEMMNSWRSSQRIPGIGQGNEQCVMCYGSQMPSIQVVYRLDGIEDFNGDACSTRAEWIKLSSVLESTKTWMRRDLCNHWKDAGRFMQIRELEMEEVWLTSAPSSTDELVLLA